MKITVLTLFPEFIQPLLNFSIIKRAIERKLIQLEIINFRNFSKDKNKRVDAYQIGGGEGMVLRLEPIVECLNSLDKGYKILLTPQGKTLNQKKVVSLAKQKHLILICGHYEGFDERISHFIDEEISIGDYVLTNGEIPALILIDAVSRLVDGVIKKESYLNESFENDLLDYPVYTKPINYLGYSVPEVLLSGNHEKIKEYRKLKQIENTKTKRPDLYNKYLRGKKHE
ncbi:MAG: tRNA (guanosine(37)-N1)-methyltransferase TrmD [Mycoplasmataceae bacterium]|nr:tRNA (guanosine(37)-N1)-methyltransferase TrmD [Mycoplasmataceae bacterium]